MGVEDRPGRGQWELSENKRARLASHQPALAAVLLLLAHPQPLAEQEALAAWRGAGRGTVGPGGYGVLVAGRRDLDGGQLQVLLGGRVGAAHRAPVRRPTLFPLFLPLFLLLPLARHVSHAAHFEALPPQRRGGVAGPDGMVRGGAVAAVRVDGGVERDAHLDRGRPEGLGHARSWLPAPQFRA